MAVSGSPVSVAAELAVVAQPRIGAFNDPSEPGTKRLLDQTRVTPFGATLNVEVVEAATGQLGADFGIAITTVEVQGVDFFEKPRAGDVVKGWAEQFDVVAVGAIDGPADRDATGVGGDRPFPSQFGALSVGLGPVTCPPQGALWREPSSDTSQRSKPMIRS